jgi:hypothetical protein
LLTDTKQAHTNCIGRCCEAARECLHPFGIAVSPLNEVAILIAQTLQAPLQDRDTAVDSGCLVVGRAIQEVKDFVAEDEATGSLGLPPRHDLKLRNGESPRRETGSVLEFTCFPTKNEVRALQHFQSLFAVRQSFEDKAVKSRLNRGNLDGEIL